MHDLRIKTLQDFLINKNIDAFLVSNFYNVFYLSSFKTLSENEREAWLLITQKNWYIFTDSRYKNGSQQILLVSPEKSLIGHMEDIINKEGLNSITFEEEDLRFSEFYRLKKHLKIPLLPVSRLIIKQREIKGKEEIENIKKACKISDQCLDSILRSIKVGWSEKEIAFKLEFWLKNKVMTLPFIRSWPSMKTPQFLIMILGRAIIKRSKKDLWFWLILESNIKIICQI